MCKEFPDKTYTAHISEHTEMYTYIRYTDRVSFYKRTRLLC